MSLWSQLCRWADFVKISHTVFALPFALASMAIAARENRGWPGWKLFSLIVAAMFLARTCAMTFNRIVDRKFDALNPRTARRHLPAGELSEVRVELYPFAHVFHADSRIKIAVLASVAT